MLSLLDDISNCGWATWVREAPTIFAYGTVLAAHTFGMILVVGISLAVALRTLGVASDLPIEPLRKYVPLMWVGSRLGSASFSCVSCFASRALRTFSPKVKRSPFRFGMTDSPCRTAERSMDDQSS